MYENNLGIKGNLEKAFKLIIKQSNNQIQSEQNIREETEVQVIQLEQQATEAYLNNIETQQAITELELMIIGGKL